MLRQWIDRWKRSREVRRLALAGHDKNLIAQQVPELAGLSEVEGMAYVLQQIEEWKAVSTQEQQQEFKRRGLESIKSFDQYGLVMPYWGALWVLRTYQASLGLDVPRVAIEPLQR